jgi:ubiquinone biosynthesis protein COQ9
MAQKRKPDQKKLIAETALALADKAGWAYVTVDDIAKKSKAKIDGDIYDILHDVLTRLEQQTATDVAKRLGDNWRDNLFEVLMTRFDLVQQHRFAYASIPALFKKDPKQAARFAKGFYDTMKGMLELAGFEKNCLQPLHLVALAAAYATIVDAWMKDDSRDLTKTMAMIDKRLGQFEKVVERSAKFTAKKAS